MIDGKDAPLGASCSILPIRNIFKEMITVSDSKNRLPSKNISLLAIWSDKHVTRNGATHEADGAYVDVQVDQSNMTASDARAGKASSNPHIETYPRTDEKYPKMDVLHSVWYSKSQLDAMMAAGETVKSSGKNVCAFTANIGRVASKDGKKGRTIVLLPKDPSKASNEDERRKIDAYNSRNPVGKSANERVDEGILERQDRVTAYTAMVEKNRAAKERQAIRADRKAPTRKQKGKYPSSVMDPKASPQERLDGMSSYSIDYVTPTMSAYAHSNDIAAVARDEYRVVRSVESMLERNGGFKVIEYPVAGRDDDFRIDCSHHDGFMRVDLNTGKVSVFCNQPTWYGPSIHRVLGNAGGDRLFREKGFELAWYDSPERQAFMQPHTVQPYVSNKGKDDAVAGFVLKDIDDPNGFVGESGRAEVKEAIGVMADRDGGLVSMDYALFDGTEDAFVSESDKHDGLLEINKRDGSIRFVTRFSNENFMYDYVPPTLMKNDMDLCWFDSKERQLSSTRRFQENVQAGHEGDSFELE